MAGMVSLLMVQCRFTRLVFWCGLNRFQKYSSEAKVIPMKPSQPKICCILVPLVWGELLVSPVGLVLVGYFDHLSHAVEGEWE